MRAVSFNPESGKRKKHTKRTCHLLFVSPQKGTSLDDFLFMVECWLRSSNALAEGGAGGAVFGGAINGSAIVGGAIVGGPIVGGPSRQPHRRRRHCKQHQAAPLSGATS